MKALRLFPSLLIAVAMTFLLLVASRAADDASHSVKFSDPAKPGTLKVQLARGDLVIEGADSADVSVRAEAPATPKSQRKDGLRVLSASSTFELTEKDNVITLDALGDGWVGTPSNFRITVPRNTQVVVQNSFGGNILCKGLSGDLDINSMNGEIRLDGITGGVVVQTMNGEIRATVAELHDNRPLSFTSMNGEVLLRVPEAAKANVRLRTQNGSVLTDFPENVLVTKTESTPRMNRPKIAGESSSILSPEAREAIREASRVGAEAVREAAAAVRAAAEAAREGVNEARAPDAPTRSATPKPPRPPRPPIPTVTGGKLVTGTLNGGGPEISIATMNGDVTLRRLEAK